MSPLGRTMPKRTSITDLDRVEEVDDLEEVVRDKRENWRATGAKARRRQRRYKNLLTNQLMRRTSEIGAASDDFAGW